MTSKEQNLGNERHHVSNTSTSCNQCISCLSSSVWLRNVTFFLLKFFNHSSSSESISYSGSSSSKLKAWKRKIPSIANNVKEIIAKWCFHSDQFNSFTACVTYWVYHTCTYMTHSVHQKLKGNNHISDTKYIKQLSL